MPGMHQAGLGRECQERGVLGGNHKFAFLSSLGSHFSRKRDLHSAPVEKRLIEFSSEKDSRDGAPLRKEPRFCPGWAWNARASCHPARLVQCRTRPCSLKCRNQSWQAQFRCPATAGGEAPRTLSSSTTARSMATAAICTAASCREVFEEAG